MTGMARLVRHVRAVLFGGLLAAVAARSAAAPASQPAEQEWGTAQGGLQLSLTVDAAAAAQRRLLVRIALRNVGAAAVELPPAGKAFAWVLVASQSGDVFFTDRFAAVPAGGAWPAALAGGAALAMREVDLTPRGAYGRDRRQEVYTAWLKADSDANAPSPPSTVARELSPGPARARAMLCLPRKDAAPTVLVSNMSSFTLPARDMAGLSPEERKERAVSLLKKFDRDAFAAREAHGEAVALGPAAAEVLIAAVKDRSRPDYSRLWLATAIADIRDARCAAALVELLGDGQDGVRCVVCYHGPKQDDAKLDRAIVAYAAGSGSGQTVSYALLGFLVFRKFVPGTLLEAGLASRDARARAAFCQAVRSQASPYNISRLSGLLDDREERVRALAAEVLGEMARPDVSVCGALVRALQAPGDQARKCICEALGKLSGKPMPYDPADDAAAKDRVIAWWRRWLATTFDKP